MSTRRRRCPSAMAGACAAVGLAILTAGCSHSATASDPPPASGSQVTVFAASSLTAAFTTIGRQFELEHPGTTVRFNFAGSADLVAQLQQGAPADVFATADTATMNKALNSSLVSGSPKDFATNSLMIAVPPSNPGMIRTFADLTNPGAHVVVCAPVVPCGAATKTVERKTGVTLTPVSEESAATDVLNKVASGEADAGVVYVTDVKRAAGRVTGIAIATNVNAVNTYPIAVLASSSSPTLAQQFESMVLGPLGQRVLADAGFAVP